MKIVLFPQKDYYFIEYFPDSQLKSKKEFFPEGVIFKIYLISIVNNGH